MVCIFVCGGFPGGARGEEPACPCRGDIKDVGVILGSGRSREEGMAVLLPVLSGESTDQACGLVYHPTEPDMTEETSRQHVFFVSMVFFEYLPPGGMIESCDRSIAILKGTSIVFCVLAVPNLC